MSIDTDELRYMVRRILSEIPESNHWPSNITDIVFQKICESKFVYLKQYERIIGRDKEHQQTVNQRIGMIVKEFTKLETVREGEPAKLGKPLIQSYTVLG